MSKEAEANGDEYEGPVQIDALVDKKPPSCCICLDVRVGTAMIGLIHLFCHAIWIVSLSYYFVHREPEEKNWEVLDRVNAYAQQHKHHVSHHMVAMIVACLSFLVVVMLIFGAVLRRSAYILPFFCMQVFDICLTVLVAATFINYAPHLKFKMEMAGNASSACIQKMRLDQFRMIIFSVWMIIILIKYYLASVVWDCYNHCKKLEERRAPLDAASAILLYQGDMETMNLLPSYDDVIKTSPPPAYQ